MKRHQDYSRLFRLWRHHEAAPRLFKIIQDYSGYGDIMKRHLQTVCHSQSMWHGLTLALTLTLTSRLYAVAKACGMLGRRYMPDLGA